MLEAFIGSQVFGVGLDKTGSHLGLELSNDLFIGDLTICVSVARGEGLAIDGLKLFLPQSSFSIEEVLVLHHLLILGGFNGIGDDFVELFHGDLSVAVGVEHFHNFKGVLVRCVRLWHWAISGLLAVIWALRGWHVVVVYICFARTVVPKTGIEVSFLAVLGAFWDVIMIIIPSLGRINLPLLEELFDSGGTSSED